jgi:hypothetical protein
MVSYVQTWTGFLKRTLTDKLGEVVSVGDFGAKPGTGTDQGPAIAAANAYAQSVNAELVFPGGEYTIGPGTSFTIDLSKTRWRGAGPVTLKWSANPTGGVAVTVLNSEVTPYETVRRIVGRVLDNIAIVGASTSASLYAGVGIRYGNGTNQTCNFTVSQVTVSGWATALDFTNNVWSVTHHKCRILWGAINTPATAGNWGENNVFEDCFIADGVTFTINYGEWRFFGGSLDNAQLLVKNYAYVSGHGLHIENPGTTTIARPFIDIQGNEATVHLVAPVLVINNSGVTGSITTSPFNVVSTNVNNGLVLDGLQFTQGGHLGFFSLVSGGGRVVARAPKILGLSNFNFMVLAENARGKLRNYGFETGDISGWTFTPNTSFGTLGEAIVGTTRVRPGSTGSKSVELKITKTADVYGDSTISQKLPITSNDMLMVRLGYSKKYTTLNSQFAMRMFWTDADGAAISTSSTGFSAANAGTDDGTTWNTLSYIVVAPAGATQVRIEIMFQSLNGIGTSSLFVDDVYVNIV